MATFPTGVAWSLHAADPFLTFDAGPLQARVAESTGHIQLAGPDLGGAAHANVITIAPPAVLTAGGVEVIGKVASSSPLPNGLALTQAAGGHEVTAHLTFAHDGVLRYEVVDWGTLQPQQTAVAAPSTGNEHFYGFGEKFNALDQAGKSVDVLTFDDPGTKGDRSYKVAPWFVSTRGYGFHYDTTAECTFDMRKSAGDHYVLTNRFGTLAFNLVYGPALPDVLTRYTGYTGRPALPPQWAFGPWISSDVWPTGGEVRYAVTQFAARNIAVSGFVYDSPWEVAYNDFTFNMTQFGADATIEGTHYPGFTSLADMMAFLQRNGLKAICWMAPFVNTQSGAEGIAGQNLGQAANYAEGKAKNFFVRSSAGGPALEVNWWKGRGSPIDFTNPDAVAWTQGQLKALLAAAEVTTANGGKEPAIGGFKTDDGESGNGPNTYIPTTAHYADGRTGAEMRNGYCIEYHKSIWNVLGTGGLLFARSGMVGTPAFPGCWAGDNEPNFGANGLPGVIVAGQSAAMSGYAVWGHDVGGYQDTNFSQSPPNLFMRWAQFGCFSPLMQMHRQIPKGLQYPWRYGEAALANYVSFTQLHTRLFPYIYTYATIASTTGVPIIRPLVLLHQADQNTYGVEHAYCFGNELLVAPMLTPNANARTLYLPEGTWIDFWSHASHPGGQNITWTNADQAQLPLFVKAGAILPMVPETVRSLCDAGYVNNPAVATWDGSLVLQVYPAGASSFAVYDGTTAQSDAGAKTVTVTSHARHLQVKILVPAKPAAITLNGTAVTEGSPGFPSWVFGGGFVTLSFDHPGGTATVAY